MAKSKKRPIIDEFGNARYFPDTPKPMPNFMQWIPSWLNAIPTVEAAERNSSYMGRQYSSVEISDIINRQSDQVSGGDKEFAKIMHAIVLTESGGNPYAIGDNGDSIGLFQNNMAGGRGAGHKKEDLLNPEYNASISIPALYRVYLDGAMKGLRGSDLVAYVSRNGQRPAAGLEWNAAKNYGRTIGDLPIVMNEQTTQEQFNKGGKNLHGIDYGNMIKRALMPPVEAAEATYSPFQLRDQLPFTPRTQAQPKTQIQPAYPFRPPSLSYNVQKGDTLWGIAQRYLGAGQRWGELQGYTGEPRRMPIGTQITVNKPSSWGGYQPKVSEMRPAQPYSPMAPVTRPTSVRGVSVSYTPTPPRPSPAPSPTQRTSYQTPAYQAPQTRAPVQSYQQQAISRALSAPRVSAPSAQIKVAPKQSSSNATKSVQNAVKSVVNAITKLFRRK